MKKRHPLSSFLPLLLALPLSALAQETYREPADAAQALVDALGATQADPDKLEEVLGRNWKDLIPADGTQRGEVDEFLGKYRERHEIEPRGDDRAYLSVGNQPWILPIPLARGSNGWQFDTGAGVEEGGARRIEANELAAIQSLQAYRSAQAAYARVDRDDDGILEYAQKLVSDADTHDGLYWPKDDSGQDSPLGQLLVDSRLPGSWHGYHFRILTAQGPSAPGGSQDYTIGGDMTRGFAIVAWPAAYGDTGVRTFMTSHDGKVFAKDLGPQGGNVVVAMRQFDPGDGWQAVGQPSP